MSDKGLGLMPPLYSSFFDVFDQAEFTSDRQSTSALPPQTTLPWLARKALSGRSVSARPPSKLAAPRSAASI